MFGKMNEDLHQGEYNAEIGEDGFIRMLSNCDSGELLTRYGPKYNWDALKQKALLGLTAEVGNLFPSMQVKYLKIGSGNSLMAGALTMNYMVSDATMI